jgi:hypothetical protein
MLEFLTSRGFAVHLSAGLVLLTHKDRPDVTLDYPSLAAAYKAHGGPARNLLYTGGKSL